MPRHMFALNTHEKMGSDNTSEKAKEYATLFDRITISCSY